MTPYHHTAEAAVLAHIRAPAHDIFQAEAGGEEFGKIDGAASPEPIKNGTERSVGLPLTLARALRAISCIAVASVALLTLGALLSPDPRADSTPQALNVQHSTSLLRRNVAILRCRPVNVETDEGYGVSGRRTRWICRRLIHPNESVHTETHLGT